MKLLSAVASLLAANTAYGAVTNPYIPFDCYQNSEKAYGINKGEVESDKDVVSGLHPTDHRLVQISYCIDNLSQTFTGVTTTWAIWEGDEWEDVKRLDIIGSLSALYDFDRNGALCSFFIWPQPLPR